MIQPAPRYSKEEFTRRGQEIFEREIAPNVQTAPPEDYVAIDIERGAFAVDPDLLSAVRRLREQNSDAQVWIRRVGSQCAVHFGGRPEPKSR